MSATAVTTSPSKASSLKRPQVDGTRRNSTSGQSPDQSFKKARLNGVDSNGVKDIGRGGRWMVEKLEELERLYKAVVKAATIILQYQAFAIRLGKDAQKLPVHLRRRVNIAWGSYEASRRQVQSYMNESAQQATTPSSRHFAMPVPLPPANASLSVPVTGTTNLPLASPIPLSEATMLSFDHPPTGSVQTQPAPEPASATTESKPFPFDMMQNTNQIGNNNTNGMFDLQGMNLASNGMSEFAAMLQQSSQDFTLDGLMGSGNGNGQPSNVQDQSQPPPNNSQAADQNPQAPDNTNPGDNETDQLLAQLGAFAAQDGATQPVDIGMSDDQVAGGMGDDDINALLASLGDTDGQDFTNFDFGSSLDMANLGEMAGLFNTSTTVESDLKSDIPPESLIKAENTNAPVAPTTTTKPAEGQNQEAPIDLTVGETAPVRESAAPPVVEPKKEEDPTQSVMDNNDFTAIDLDDFNFGDGDEAPEGMGMSGDEFDRLLAGAFND